MALVVLEGVSKVFPGGVHAVRDLSLKVGDGEFVVLVGPSGCGKSTTLRIVAGLEDPSSGTITIGERIVNRVHPRDRNIAMVFQNYALYPHMTAYNNMAFGLKMRKTPKKEIDRRVREAAGLLGITPLLNRKPHSLSGGQRQRVAVGRAIVRDPACFLFDEPLSNLDVKLRLQMRAEIKALHLRLKTTTIYVTHDQEEAMTLGDRIAVMADGEIQQLAPPLEVYQRPVNRFVAGFVGLPPMNFIDGHVSARGGELVFADRGEIAITLPDGYRRAEEAIAGRAVVLGVRPEALRLAHPNFSAEGSALIRGTVRVVEPLGDRQDVYATTSRGDPIIARLDATAQVAPGQSIALALRDAGSIHLFHPGEFGRHV